MSTDNSDTPATRSGEASGRPKRKSRRAAAPSQAVSQPKDQVTEDPVTEDKMAEASPAASPVIEGEILPPEPRTVSGVSDLDMAEAPATTAEPRDESQADAPPEPVKDGTAPKPDDVAEAETADESTAAEDAVAAEEPASEEPAEPPAEEAEPEAEPAVPPSPEKPVAEKRPGILPFAATALIGAAIAIGANYVLAGSGLGPTASPSAATAPAEDARIGDLAAKLATLDKTISALPTAPADVAAHIAALDQRVAALEEATGTAAPAAGGTPPPSPVERLAALTDRIDRLSAETEALKTDTAKRLDALAAGAKDANDATASRIKTIEDTLAKAPEQRRIAALSLTAAALGGAVASGTPYATELKELAGLAPDLPEVAALQPYAETGVARTPALIAGFPDRAILATVSVPEDASLSDRLLAGAKSWVNWRSDSDAKGTLGQSVQAISDDLAKSDLKAALGAWNALPEPAKAASKAWGAELTARVAVDDAVAALTATIVHTLTVPAN